MPVRRAWRSTEPFRCGTIWSCSDRCGRPPARRRSPCLSKGHEVQGMTVTIERTEEAAASRESGTPVALVHVVARPGWIERGAKRLLDVGLSGTGVCLSLPLWVAIAAAVKLEDGGDVFYGQERVGQGGRVFRVLKFRSIIPDAEARVGALQASANDPPITRVGKWLRATAMDELPQLLSIARGDMSFVGPRALRPGEIEVLGDGQHVA